MKIFVLKLIKGYQKIFSFDYGLMGKIFPNTRLCRFNPTCSQYTYDAVKKHGVVKGLHLGIKRLLKCNAFLTPITGTYDPVV